MRSQRVRFCVWRDLPKETVFADINQAVQKFQYDPVVVHELQGNIDLLKKYGVGGENLEVFHRDRTEYYGLIVTENSPLGPMLRYGTKLLFERGILDNLKKMWLGGDKTCRGSQDLSGSKLVLEMSHVVGVFFILGLSVCLCFVLFLCELSWTRRQEITEKYRNAVLHQKCKDVPPKIVVDNKGCKEEMGAIENPKEQHTSNPHLGQLFELIFRDDLQSQP